MNEIQCDTEANSYSRIITKSYGLNKYEYTAQARSNYEGT